MESVIEDCICKIINCVWIAVCCPVMCPTKTNLAPRLESVIEAGDFSVSQDWGTHPVLQHQTHREH